MRSRTAGAGRPARRASCVALGASQRTVPRTSQQQPPTRAVRRTGFRHGLRRLSRAELAFTVIGLLTVCALIALGLGSAVFDGTTSSSSSADKTPAYDAASSDLEASLSTKVAANPKDTASMALLANLLGNEGKLDQAIPWYEKVLALNPNDWTTRLDFAESLANGGKDADAELQYQKVIVAQPDNVQAHFYLGELYRTWQPPRVDEAVREYRRVIALAPTDYLAQKARQELAALGQATPGAATPPATPQAGG